MDPAPRCPACDAALPADPRPPRAAGARLRCGRCGAGFGAPQEPAATVPAPGGTPAQAAADATSGDDAAAGATRADAATAAAPDAAATDAAGSAAAAGAAAAQAAAGLAAPGAGASVASAPAPAAIDAAPPHDGDDDAREPVAAARPDGSPSGARARADAPAAGPTAAAATGAPAAQPAGADAAAPGDPDAAGDAPPPPAARRDPLPPEGPFDLPLPPPSPGPPDPPGPPGPPDEPDFAVTEPPLPLPLRPEAPPPHRATARTATAADAEAALLSFLAGEPAADPRWQHPALRPALGAVATLLALALAAQAALHWRDALAAARPGLRPAIEALCLAAGCSVGPLRRLDDVTVEGSEWNPSPSGSAAQLVVVLRNAGDLPVALPWVELTLTEVNGALLARRALAPGDFGAAATLAPAREAVLRATLAVDGRPPAGYTVELFHP